MTLPWRLRAAVLTLAGVLGVHQVRFRFAPVEHEHELAAAHVYLPWLTAAAGALLFLAIVQLAVCVHRRAERAPRIPRVPVLWLAATATLLCVFGTQESLETLLSHGHLPALAELLGEGGWTAVPTAVAAGALIALLLRGAAGAVAWVLARRPHRPRRAAAAVAIPAAPALAPRGSLLARRLAGRAPPAAA